MRILEAYSSDNYRISLPVRDGLSQFFLALFDAHDKEIIAPGFQRRALYVPNSEQYFEVLFADAPYPLTVGSAALFSEFGRTERFRIFYKEKWVQLEKDEDLVVRFRATVREEAVAH